MDYFRHNKIFLAANVFILASGLALAITWSIRVTKSLRDENKALKGKIEENKAVRDSLYSVIEIRNSQIANSKQAISKLKGSLDTIKTKLVDINEINRNNIGDDLESNISFLAEFIHKADSISTK